MAGGPQWAHGVRLVGPPHRGRPGRCPWRGHPAVQRHYHVEQRGQLRDRRLSSTDLHLAGSRGRRTPDDSAVP